jgi:hypothetical protein
MNPMPAKSVVQVMQDDSIRILHEFAKTIERFGLGGEFQASTSEVTERHLDQPRPQQCHLVGIAP